MGAPLEDARQLAQCYDRVHQEAEAQVKVICRYGDVACLSISLSFYDRRCVLSCDSPMY